LHGSDSGAFTQNGDLDERRFDYVFSMYSTPPHTHLTFAEGVRMLRGNRNVCDLVSPYPSPSTSTVPFFRQY
jgi:hypothetical protein